MRLKISCHRFNRFNLWRNIDEKFFEMNKKLYIIYQDKMESLLVYIFLWL